MTKKEYRLIHQNVHHWLRYNFGSAQLCEMKDCSGESKKYEWSLIRGKTHDKNRKNYRQMCKKCHMAYDHGQKHPTAQPSSRVARSKFDELLRPYMVRINDNHRSLIKRLSKEKGRGEAQIVRDAIDAYAQI